jgi:hypothetical protein
VSAPLALELDGDAAGLLDDPLPLRVRGADAGEALVWRARYRDDDARVWRASGTTVTALVAGFAPAKPGGAPARAALASLRPVDVDVRVEAPDGRSAARTLTRRLVADGVRVRRWRDGVSATLALPAAPAPSLVLDATGAEPDAAAVAGLAAPLLASRGVLVLVVLPARAAGAGAGLAPALERLAAVPGAAPEPLVLAAAELVVPPGVGVRDDPDPAGRAAAWDALLARIGARARVRAAAGPGGGTGPA